MDSDLLFLVGAAGMLMSFPLLIVLSITSCIAWKRTRKWQKQKSLRHLNYSPSTRTSGALAESDPLVPSSAAASPDHAGSDSDSDSDLDPEDSDYEEEIKARHEDKIDRNDWHLTTGQKFGKELMKAWKGKNVKLLTKKKERKERKLLARAVARELIRMEKRGERRAGIKTTGYEGVSSEKRA